MSDDAEACAERVKVSPAGVDVADIIDSLFIAESLTLESSRAMAELFGRALHAEDESELYGAIAAWLPRVLTADRASLTLVVEGEATLEVLGLTGAEGAIPLGRRLPLTSTGPGAAVETGVLQNWTVDDQPERLEVPAMIEAGLSAVMNAPLVVHGSPIGALNVAKAGEGYQVNDSRLLYEIAALVSSNLERFQAVARAREELVAASERQGRLEILGHLGRRLSSVTDEDAAFLILAELVAGLLPVDRLSLAFPDLAAGTFRITGLSQEGEAPDGLADGDTIPLAGSAIEHAAVNGELHYLPDMSLSPSAAQRRLAEAGFRSGFSVPVLAGGGVTAVLNCASGAVDAYQHEDRVTAEAIASIVGEALDRIRTHEALVIRDRQLASIVDESPSLMLTVGPNGHIVQLSEFGASQLGYEADEVRGRNLDSLYAEDQRALIAAKMTELAQSADGAVLTWEAQMLNAAGERRWIRHSGRRWSPGDDSTTIILACQDVTTLFELTDRLEHEATHDALTGLVNRREFDVRLSAMIEGVTTAATTGSVCYLDVDHFKIVNDTSGHRAGDSLLVDLATLFVDLLQPDDVVARLGGDEFAILLPNTSLASAVRVAERLRAAAGELVFSWDGRTFGTSLSIGVAAIDAEHTDSDEVLGRADDACYQAKHNGRNQVSIGGAGVGRSRSARPDGEWGSRLREAIRNDQLLLAAQPIAAIDPADGLDRLELLVRLANGADEPLHAGLFIPAAERLGIVSEIDRWVVSEATSLLTAGDPRFAELDFVSVNLSACSIESEDFLDFLVDALAKPGLDPSRFLFEITETAALSQFSKAVRFIETVATVGSRFALDDFGAGFSTFHYLKRLPVHVLKIDGSLVQDLHTDPIDRSIVRSIVEVAGTLGMRTVGEFVESPSTLDQLRGLGVDYAQGFEIGRPEVVRARTRSFGSD